LAFNKGTTASLPWRTEDGYWQGTIQCGKNRVCSAVIGLFILGRCTQLIEVLTDTYIKCELAIAMVKGRSALTASV